MPDFTVQVHRDILGNHFALCSCNWSGPNRLRTSHAHTDGEKHEAAHHPEVAA